LLIMPSDNKTFYDKLSDYSISSLLIMPSDNKTFYDKYSNKINDIIYYVIT
jgi:hypothetical protein